MLESVAEVNHSIRWLAECILNLAYTYGRALSKTSGRKKKEEIVWFLRFAYRFRSISTITKVAMTIATIMPIVAGIK
jgi:hypothetical protein